MKGLRLLVLIVFIALNANAQVLKFLPSVDERTELLGVVFRLAGANEFSNRGLASYSQDIDEYFADYKNHEAVQMARLLRSTCGIAYDAVVSLAVNVEIKNGEIVLAEGIAASSLDSRWIFSDARRFVQKLNSFYRLSDFNTFFNSHKRLYMAAAANSMYLLQNFDNNWFSEYFGTATNDSFDMILGLTHTGSFGVQRVKRDGERSIFAVIGSFHADSLGIPIYRPNMLGVIVHEFCHSFCNQLVDRHFNTIKKNAQKFYRIERQVLNQNFYGSAQVMLYESLVRACVIRYYMFKNAPQERVNQMLCLERNGGFLCVEELVWLLDVYEQNRSQYATLNDFFPVIVEKFNNLNASEIKRNIIANAAAVVDCSIKNGGKRIDPSTSEIIVTFSSEMDDNTFGVGTNPRGNGVLPRSTAQKVSWSEQTPSQLIVPIKLQPNTSYSMVFYAHLFMTRDGFPLKNNYVLSFKTSK